MQLQRPTQIQGAYEQKVDAGIRFTESFTYGDAIPTGTTVTSGVVPSLPSFGSVTTSSGGVGWIIAGTITSAGAITLTKAAQVLVLSANSFLKLP